MGAWATKSTGDTLTATEFNLVANEIENQETAGTETPAGGSSDQLAKSIVNCVGNADFYTGGGIADVYTASVIAPNVVPTSYRVGMKVRFRPNVNNTGASTIDVASLGVKSIKLQNGSSDPVAGDISTTRDTELRYDGTNFRIISQFNDASTTAKGIVELLTSAELVIGTDTTRAATAKAIADLFAGTSRGGTGYMRLPVGIGSAISEMIIQWGTENVAQNTVDTVNLGLTFPTANLACFATVNRVAVIAGGVISAYANNFSTSQIKVTNDELTAGATVDIFWLAIGY